MYGVLNPANWSVYVKLWSVIGPWTVGVQPGFGHDCCATNWSAVGADTETPVTIRLPFLSGVS
jgi:hypothetical protein